MESDKNKENELNIELNDLKSQIQEINDEIKNLKIISNIHFYCSSENRKLLELKKNEQNLQKKKKNAELIERRRKKILDKYLQTEERIKKQKDENSKDLLNKYLTIAMKREDTINNLERFERQQEFEREQKLEKLKKKDERLSAIKRQKTEINIKKKERRRIKKKERRRIKKTKRGRRKIKKTRKAKFIK